MGTVSTPVVPNPDPGAAYQAAYDALGRAYWDASDVYSKDLIYGAQQAIGDIVTAFDEKQLVTNTELFVQLTPKIKAINTALKTIKDQITTITKNIDTAGTVLSAISKVLSVYPDL